jgi:hypothetical protein
MEASLELARKDALLEEVAAANLELMSQRQMEDDAVMRNYFRFDNRTTLNWPLTSVKSLGAITSIARQRR